MMPILKIGQKNFENRAKNFKNRTKNFENRAKTLKIGPINFISDAVLVIYDPDLCSEVIEEKKTNEKSVTNRSTKKHIWITNQSTKK